MAKKYPSQLNTKLTRLYKADNIMLLDLSRQNGTTVAEVTHLLLTGQLKELLKLQEKKESWSPVQSYFPGAISISRPVTSTITRMVESEVLNGHHHD